MSAVCTVLDVARSNIAERLVGRPRKPLGRPPQPDDDLVATIKAVIADMPSYGYRRVHAILCRKARATGDPLPNHKRVYRVMKAHGVNGGLNPGQRSGVKPGQWIGHADMERAPIGALSMSARIFDQAAVISPVSGSMLSAVAWFCSALTDARRRPTDCLRR